MGGGLIDQEGRRREKREEEERLDVGGRGELDQTRDPSSFSA